MGNHTRQKQLTIRFIKASERVLFYCPEEWYLIVYNKMFF